MMLRLCRPELVLLAILCLRSGVTNMSSGDTRAMPTPRDASAGKISGSDSAGTESGTTAEQGLTHRTGRGLGDGRGGAYDHHDHEISTDGVDDLPEVSVNREDDSPEAFTKGIGDLPGVFTNGVDHFPEVGIGGRSHSSEAPTNGVDDDLSEIATNGIDDLSVSSSYGEDGSPEVSTGGVDDLSEIATSRIHDLSVSSSHGEGGLPEISTNGVEEQSEVFTSEVEEMSLHAENGAVDRHEHSGYDANDLITNQNTEGIANTRTPSIAVSARPSIVKFGRRYTNVKPDCTLTYSTSPDYESTSSECTRPAFLDSHNRTEDLSSFRSSVAFRSSDFELCSSETGSPCAWKVLDGSITFRSDDVVLTVAEKKRPQKTFCLQLLVPSSMVLLFQRKEIQDRTKNLYLAKVYDDDKIMWIQSNDFSRGIQVYSIRNRVTVSVGGSSEEFQEAENLLAFTLSFQAVPACASLQLEVKCPTDNATGWVQTPGWDGQREYPALLDSCVTLMVPPDHVIMTSFVSIDLQWESCGSCLCDVIELYLTPACEGAPESNLCQSSHSSSRVFHTPTLSIRFLADSNEQRTGFRFLYSFHQSSERPVQLLHGWWNCSGPGGPVLRQHFICSPDPSCWGEEYKLEGRCSVGDLCGAMNVFHLDDRCYVYVSPHRLSWEEAVDACLVNQGHLVSLSTPGEWNHFISWRENFTRELPDYMFVGLSLASPSLPDMYRNMWQWSDGIVAMYVDILLQAEVCPPYCAAFHATDNRLSLVQCSQRLQAGYICEMTAGPELASNRGLQSSIRFPTPSSQASEAEGMVICPNSHATHRFLACDLKSDCYAVTSHIIDACVERLSPPIPMFTCRHAGEQVPYTMVCDHRSDCWDKSDEDFCVFPRCGWGQFACGDNKQCVFRTDHCDGRKQCVDGSDEWQCWESLQKNDIITNTKLPPAVIDFTSAGAITVTSLNASCPETHFRCSNDGYCLPVYVRCNGVYDCPGREDEEACDVFSCPGFYRCRDSRICVHRDHLCDDVFQCPQHDDEAACEVTCAPNCTCYRHAFVCSSEFPGRFYPDLRYLDASGTGMDLTDVSENRLLIYLSLKNCGITVISELDLPNLQNLDLSYNLLTSFPGEKLSKLNNLRSLSLAFNSLRSLYSVDHTVFTFPKLTSLDISGTMIHELNGTLLSIFPKVENLNFSRSGLQKVSRSGFSALKHLRVLDLRNCPMEVFSLNLFGDLIELRAIYADNYKLCCPAVLPESFNPDRCHAPFDEVSSCAALLRTEVFRVFLVVYALLALVGNLASFVYRVFLIGVAKTRGFDVFVTHLCVSDFLMGVYLAIIGVADRVYYGSYEWNDSAWKNSAVCKMAGFLSLLSSEVSAFFICFITLERWLVICFPYKRLRFSRRSAQVASLMVWVVGVILSSVPLLPLADGWKFYGQTGMCIPLPVTRTVFAGRDYVFGVMIVLNFVLFLLIASCQFLIFRSIRSSGKAVALSSSNSRDAAIARRLLAVVMTDFLCWFPIGVVGLVARIGVPIPGQVNVAMAIFVLPFNSALNPFLYTFHMMREWRREAARPGQPEQGCDVDTVRTRQGHGTDTPSTRQGQNDRPPPSRFCTTGTQTD